MYPKFVKVFDVSPLDVSLIFVVQLSTSLMDSGCYEKSLAILLDVFPRLRHRL